MGLPDTSSWSFFARTPIVTFYVVEPGVLAGVVDEGAKDTAETAHVNIEISHEYYREHGPGMIVYFLSGLLDQTTGARRTYQRLGDSDLVYCAALVVGSMISRAIGTFFVGLAKPTMPVKVVGSLEDALAWGRPICAGRRKSR